MDSELLLEPIGLQGSPLQTLSALEQVLPRKLEGGTVILILDSNEHRDNARVAILVDFSGVSYLSQDAFGGRFGVAGRDVLASLITKFLSQGITHFKEAAFAPHEFTRLLEYPDLSFLLRVRAKANPTDPDIYRSL